MAGKKAQGNKHRKQKYESRRSNNIPAKNKKRRWERQQAKMERKALARGEKWEPKYKTFEQYQEASKAACKRGIEKQVQRHKEQRAAAAERKKKKRTQELVEN